METIVDPYAKLRDECLDNLVAITNESRLKLKLHLEAWEKISDRKERERMINHYYGVDEMKGYLMTDNIRRFDSLYELPSRIENRNGGWQIFVPRADKAAPPIDARLVPSVPSHLRTICGQIISEINNFVAECGRLRTLALARQNQLALARRQKELVEREIARLEAA